MHRAAQDHTRTALNEAEAFAEEMRNLRASSPWTGVLLFTSAQSLQGYCC